LCWITFFGSTAVAQPADPVQSFTPNLGAAPFEARADEAGQYSVSEQTGSPGYSYRFVVPPGRLGVEPSIALAYSPGSRQIAEGWGLNMPRIDIATEEGVSNSVNPVFAARLGKTRDRLTLVEDVHTQPGTLTYRALVDNEFIRYELFLKSIGVEHWEARTTDGTMYVFGAVLGDGWGLTQVTDRFSNRMDISYTSMAAGGRAQLYPTDFWYTANSNAGLAAHAHMHLAWETSTVGARTSYRTGTRVVEGAGLIRSAYTEVNDAVSTDYALPVSLRNR
jgi:hypothetical protein